MCLIIISVVAVSMFSLKQAFGSRVINQLESDKSKNDLGHVVICCLTCHNEADFVETNVF